MTLSCHQVAQLDIARSWTMALKGKKKLFLQRFNRTLAIFIKQYNTKRRSIVLPDETAKVRLKNCQQYFFCLLLSSSKI